MGRARRRRPDRRRAGRPRRRLRPPLDRRAGPRDRSRATSPARPGSGSLAVDEAPPGPTLRWEPSRGGALFPHLYRPLARADVLWAPPLPSTDGRPPREPRPSTPASRCCAGSTPRRRMASRSPRCALGLGPHARPVTSPAARHPPRRPRPAEPRSASRRASTRTPRRSPALGRAGFGFVEVGAATPRPQPGNPRPRLFRLPEDRAVINRFGFNNDGMEAIAARLARRPPGGRPRPQPRRQQGQRRPRRRLRRGAAPAGPFADFATVNVSSPNTERLRDLQGRAALAALLAGVMEANARLARPVPVLLKIAPDLTDAELADVAEVALEAGVAGIVATNTTLARDGLRSRHAGESGRPLRRPALRALHAGPRAAPRLTDSRLPLIGVGGVASRRGGLRQDPRGRLRGPALHRPSPTAACRSRRESLAASTPARPPRLRRGRRGGRQPAGRNGWPLGRS